MADTTYTRLDRNGLLFFCQQLKQAIDKAAAAGGVTVDTAISASSTNANAAGSKAVYDFVTSALAGITGFHAEIVSELPDSGSANVLYLLPKADGIGVNVYDEYMFIGNSWELIGSTDIDLSDYLQKSELSPLTSAEITAIISNAKS